MNRRHLIAGSLATSLALGARAIRSTAAQEPATLPFDADVVRNLARHLAQQPFKPQDRTLPKELQNIDYDAYRALRFRTDRALWRGEELPFQVQFFHRGFIYLDRVDLFEVTGGRAHPIRYSPTLFDFGPLTPPAEGTDLGFAGFRLHAPINRPDYYDEIGVFLGASYFRAVAKHQVYGLSARGLAIRTADPKGEEFPAFRSFWIERPQKQTVSIVIHALLDSESAAAAFRFTIRPGETTVFDVETAIYPRVDIAEVGIAPLTSMFFFGPNDRVGVDDFRQAVHDSDGLAIRNGRGEQIWRPLINPRDLQVSVYEDTNPRGFGLLQRERDFRGFEDIESRFEKRPSLWVEPIGDWGDGSVHLVEIPTKEEIHDNIVSFWRPRQPLRAKGEHRLTYRLHWGAGKPDPELAEFTKTRVGAGPEGSRRFVLEVQGAKLKDVNPEAVKATVSADKGEVRNLMAQPNPATGGWRVSFELVTKREPLIELRAQLQIQEERVSEVWSYRWAP